MWENMFLLLEESKERACLINELEKELDLLNIEYEATCQQRRAR